MPGRERTAILAWAGILVGPSLWGLALAASYVLVPVACGAGSAWMLHAVRVVTALGAAAAAAAAYVAWSRAEAGRSTAFLGFVGVVASGVSVALIAVEGIANFVVDPCL